MPATVEIRLDLNDLREVLSKTTVDTDQILSDASALILNRIRQRYQRGVDPEGRPWAPLSPDYRRRKLAAGFSDNTLIRTGDLFRSIQAIRDSSNQYRIGTTVRYAPYHQLGVPARNLPKREFLGVNNEDIQLITRLAAQRVARAIS